MTQTPIAPQAGPDASIQSYLHTVNAKTLRVWGIGANWEYFVTDTPESATGPTPVNFSVSGRAVRRYPGDPQPFNRAGYTATRSLPFSRGNAIPGKPFQLEAGGELRQFSYVGSLTSLYTILVTKAKMNLKLHSPSGRVYDIVKNP